MALVAPFRGLHFNPAKVGNLTDVVTPPYDVIKPAEREMFARRHPYNMVHLILPEKLPGDDRLNNRYTRAAALFRQWLHNEVFIRDPEPAYYLWQTAFDYQGKRYTRNGLVALVRLEPFSRGVILPHEQTFSAIKADRLELMKQARAHFSPIFALFPDRQGHILRRLESARPPQPLLTCEDSQGLWHCLYRVTDPPCLAEVHQALAPLRLYIADGHHRYETCLALEKWFQGHYPDAPPQASFHYTLMYLANLYDSDLVIMMAHRLLKGPRLKHLEEGALLARLAQYFEVKSVTPPGGDLQEYGEVLQQHLDTHSPRETVFIMVGFGMKAWRLKLKEAVRQRLLARQMHPTLAALDVAVLNYLVFDKIMGLDAKAQDDPENCRYTTVISDALAALKQGEIKLAFLLNPTRIDQVREVAESGLIMPRKSTYFYPKVMTGLILHPIHVEETIVLP